MTYTSNSNSYLFFVVGGNSDGTESGRVYAYFDKGYGSSRDNLYSYSHDPAAYMVWTKSDWTTDTMITLSAGGPSFQFAQASHYGLSSVAEAESIGIAGNKLFNGVKIL